MNDIPSLPRHRCAQWRDIKIHPELSLVWGTCLMHYPASKDGKHVATWGLTDEQSETVTLWKRPECPFCGIELVTLLSATP